MSFRTEQSLRHFGLAAACAFVALLAITMTGQAVAPASPAPVQAPHVEADPSVSVFVQSGGVVPDSDTGLVTH